jgi:hypothetical protein
MKTVNKECVDRMQSSVTETRNMKNSKGEIIRTWEVDVPATTYTYHRHRKCKYCGYRDYVTETKTSKN